MGMRALLILALLTISLGTVSPGPVASAQDATPVAAAEGEPIILGAAVHQSDWMAAYDLPPLEGLASLSTTSTPMGASSAVRFSSSTATVGPIRRRSATWRSS